MAVSEWIIKSELRGRCLDMVKGVVEESLRGSKLGEMKFRNNILNRMFMERGKYFEDLFLMDFQLEDLSGLWIETFYQIVWWNSIFLLQVLSFSFFQLLKINWRLRHVQFHVSKNYILYYVLLLTIMAIFLLCKEKKKVLI